MVQFECCHIEDKKSYQLLKGNSRKLCLKWSRQDQNDDILYGM